MPKMNAYDQYILDEIKSKWNVGEISNAEKQADDANDRVQLEFTEYKKKAAKLAQRWVDGDEDTKCARDLCRHRGARHGPKGCEVKNCTCKAFLRDYEMDAN